MSVLAAASAHLYSMAPIILAAEEEEPPKGGFDPGVTPNADAPWYAWLQNMTGSIMGTLILLSVVILALGVLLALVGRAVSNSTAQKYGIGGVIGGIIGVVILGSISGLVYWATGQSLF